MHTRLQEKKILNSNDDKKDKILKLLNERKLGYEGINYHLVDIYGDGNCFFRAIAIALNIHYQ